VGDHSIRVTLSDGALSNEYSFSLIVHDYESMIKQNATESNETVDAFEGVVPGT